MQVKYTSQRDNGRYVCRTTVTGRKNKDDVRYEKRLIKTKVDLFFIVTERIDIYIIPVWSLNTEYIWLGQKYDEYKVNLNMKF